MVLGMIIIVLEVQCSGKLKIWIMIIKHLQINQILVLNIPLKRLQVFTNGPVIQKTLKMVLDTFLLNTQQYKGKVEQSRERSSALPYTSV